MLTGFIELMLCVSAFGLEKSSPAVRLPALEYSATRGCPGEDAFSVEVMQRLRSMGRSVRDAEQKTWRVELWTDDRGARGRLVSIVHEEASSSREISGADCLEVERALALIAAMLATPDDPLIAPGAGDGLVPSSMDAERTRSVAATAREVEVSPVPTDGVTRPIAPSSRPDPSNESHYEWTVAAGASGSLTTGVAPSPLLGLPVHVEATLSERGMVRASVRASFLRSSSGRLTYSEGRAEFVWTVGSLEVCPYRWASGSFEIDPCLGAEGGVIEGRGLNRVPATIATRPWFAALAAGRLRWRPLEFASLELEAGGHAAMHRERYYFEPGTTVHQTSILGLVLAVGAEVRFP
jgi:hypothetical protein